MLQGAQGQSLVFWKLLVAAGGQLGPARVVDTPCPRQPQIMLQRSPYAGHDDGRTGLSACTTAVSRLRQAARLQIMGPLSLQLPPL